MLSISELLEPEDIFAEMRMERQAHHGAFLLLEGVTDIKRFSKFMVEDCSTVNCWGRPKLLEVVALVDSNSFKGALALADADFDRVINSLIASPSLIYSTCHDFDLDCVASGAIDCYLSEVADAAKLAALGGVSGVVQLHLNAIQPISCARLANCRGKITVSLADLEWDSCYTPFSINKSMYAAKALKKIGPTHDNVNRMLEFINAEEEEGHDQWQITNGHDFCVALGISLRDALGTRGKQQTSGREVELHMRLGYQFSHFLQGAVAGQIRQWEHANAPHRVLQ